MTSSRIQTVRARYMSGSPKRVGLKDPAFTRQCGIGKLINLDLGKTTLWLVVVDRSRLSSVCERHIGTWYTSRARWTGFVFTAGPRRDYRRGVCVNWSPHKVVCSFVDVVCDPRTTHREFLLCQTLAASRTDFELAVCRCSL